MRISRQKQFKRAIRFYKMAFGFHPPYSILVDSTFIQAALKHKIHLKEQLPTLFGGKCILMVTSCVLSEMRQLGASLRGAMLIAKTYKRHTCNHEDSINAQSCIINAFGESNSSRLCIATQDTTLRKQLRGIPGIPMIHLNNNVLILENPSFVSQKMHHQDEKAKLEPMDWEKKFLKSNNEETVEQQSQKKKKKGKNPNPLSCLKKQTKSIIDSKESLGKAKRCRTKRKRV